MADLTNDPEKIQRAQEAAVRLSEKQDLFDNWWMFALRGVLALALGLAALFWPQESMSLLLRIAGVVLLIDGIAALIGARRIGNFGVESGSAGIAILAGILLLFLPFASLSVAFIIIGVWAVVVGLSMLIKGRQDSDKEAPALAGALILIAGVVLIFSPGVGVWASGWLLALTALAVSFSLLYIAWRLKTWKSRFEELTARMEKDVTTKQ